MQQQPEQVYKYSLINMQKVKEKKLIKTAKKLTKKLKSWTKEAKLALEKSRRFTERLKRKKLK